MKKLLILIMFIFTAAALQAQWVQESFENTASDTLWRHPPINTGLGTGGASLLFSDISSNPAPQHGNAALKVDWVVHSTEAWGGFSQMMYLVNGNDSNYIDFSTATHLRLWYYNITPNTNSAATVNMRFKLHEAGGLANFWESQADHEDWYFEVSGVYEKAPGWNSLVIPLDQIGVGGNPNDQGFTLTGWSGQANNEILDLDKIVGYSIEWTTPGIDNQGQATGTIVFDKLELVGNRYEPVYTFDEGYNDYFTKDVMSWVGADSSQITLTPVTSDQFEGTASMKIDYLVSMSQTWGGYANITHMLPEGEVLPDLSARSHLVLYVKVLQAATGTTDRVTMRFNLYDGAEGDNEQWYHTANLDLYNTSDWQQIIIPLVSEQGNGDMNFLKTTGFIIPDWDGGFKGNKLLDLNSITGWKIEFSGTGDFGPQGEKSSGSILVDLLVPGGYRETDVTAPVPPTGLSAVGGDRLNVITWVDIPEETKETYTVYYSRNPISDLNASGVEVVKNNIPKGVQLVEHLLRAPGTDQEVSYYYAITATDAAGNTSDVANLGSPVTNTAKGVATISLSTPAFNPDGDLAEWSQVSPIVMKISDGSAFKVSNQIIDNDDDLSATAYLAIDNENLYVAFDVTDDKVINNTALASYLNDAADLFIGLYDWHGAPHGSYKRGAQPDYHIRFTQDSIMIDGLNVTLGHKGPNYYREEKFPSGYIIEAKIPLVDLARDVDSVFQPKLGMRIPLDFSINDNDTEGGEREGIMTYSPYNEDQSWSSTARWLYTWIGDQWTVGVNDEEVTPFTYELFQNYPNPFNPATQIKYSVAKSGMVSIKIFDILGRQVKELVNEFHAAGVYSVSFNAANLSSGVYLYQVKADGFQSTKKMMLIK